MIQGKNYTIYHDKMQNVLPLLAENSIDCIVTDPPYHLESIVKRFGKKDSAKCKEGKDGSFARLSKGFMGKEWDGGDVSFRPETRQQCLRVLKPGGYLLAFGGSRTVHRIACAIEDAGFEIRDELLWLYGSGFPKSMSISKAIESQKKYGKSGTSYKRKIEQESDGKLYKIKQPNNGILGNIKEANRKEYIPKSDLAKQWEGWGTALKPAYEPIIMARKPFKGSCATNIMKWGVGGINIDECRTEEGRFPANILHDGTKEATQGMWDWKTDTSASRYFYCAKASKKDRDEGLDEFESKKTTDGCIRSNSETARKFGANSALRKNTHPTVKPTELMQYLVRLVAPKGATILDPFCGSGSTGKACMFENRERNANYKFIGIEMTEEYIPIIQARLDYAENQYEYEKKKIEKEEGTISLF